MPGDYTVILKITVYKGAPAAGSVIEEASFVELTFSQMTRISSQFFELLPKLEKERK